MAFYKLTQQIGAKIRNFQPKCGYKTFTLPQKYDNVEFPERNRLKFVDKIPQYAANFRAPKMFKRLDLMRGPELIHNSLIHKQYGIIATGGGRLKWGHFEMIRLGITRNIDYNRMFAVWRVDSPWQSVTKKGKGQRMGGGKGSIDHYVTPVKSGRVIIEIGGKCEFKEVKAMLDMVAHKLPFKAKVVTQEILEQMQQKEITKEKHNLNHYTMEYVLLNNLGNCKSWLSPYDYKYFGKYV